MRPPVRPRHLLAVAIFAAVSALSGYLAMIDDRIDGNQVNMLSWALKLHDDQLYAADPLFESTGFHQAIAPTFVGMTALIMKSTGFLHVLMPLRLLVMLMTAIYLCGMYALLFSQCRSWSVSIFVTILSMAVINTPGGAIWGIGPLETATPMGMCITFIPLIILLFLHFTSVAPSMWWLMLVFLVVGLFANIHLQTSVNIMIILLVCLLTERRQGLLSVLSAAACLATAAIGALPCMLSRSLSYGADGVRPSASVANVFHTLHNNDFDVLYPEIFKPLPEWAIYLAILVIPTVIILTQVKGSGVRNLKFWILFTVAGLFIAFAVQGMLQLLAKSTNTLPLLGFCQAGGLLMIPVYALFAQALTSLLRLVTSYRSLVQWICAAMMAAWIIPSDNFRVPRRMIYTTVAGLTSEEDRPQRIQRLEDLNRRQQELQALAAWAGNNTDTNAIFLTDESSFRLYSRRAIVAGGGDGRFLFTFDTAALPAWSNRLERQDKLFHPPQGKADLQAIDSMVKELAGQKPYSTASAWYVLLPATLVPEGIEKNRLETPQGCGRYFQVYRLR